MESILLAFVTGLTTGGLSCLAVQGGLLASSLANQIEKDIQAAPPAGRNKKRKGVAAAAANRQRLALPILLFLAAKLLGYTLLGFLLGLVGSAFQLSPLARAVLQFAIGIFMIGSALRMLNVHPIFRYFVFEPPAFLRRKLRKAASANPRGSATLVTPVFLGLMTVLIPCGITQAMMAVALSTADPGAGAALMFAFTLGTSPVFFAVAYFATQLGARLEKHFLRFTAVVVLILGLVAVDTGLNLVGAPFSLTRAVNALNGSATEAQAAAPLPPVGPAVTLPEPGAGPQPADDASEENVITVNVLNTRYDPDVVRAKAGVPVRLKLVSQGVYSCSLAIVIPALNVYVSMMPDDVQYVDIPPQEAGTRMPFSCSMGMFTGDILFE